MKIVIERLSEISLLAVNDPFVGYSGSFAFFIADLAVDLLTGVVVSKRLRIIVFLPVINANALKATGFAALIIQFSG
jgi:hypothetical protein